MFQLFLVVVWERVLRYQGRKLPVQKHKHQFKVNIVCLAQMQQKIAKRFYVLIFQNVKPIWRRHSSDSLKDELYSLGFCQLPKTTFRSLLDRLFTTEMQKGSQRQRVSICKAHLTLKVTLKTLMKARWFSIWVFWYLLSISQYKTF